MGNWRKLTKTTVELERLVGDVGTNSEEKKRVIAEVTSIVGGIDAIPVRLGYEDTDVSDGGPEV